jgi:hypothetical protein
MNSEKAKDSTKGHHTDIINEIEEHLAVGFQKLKEALGEKKIKSRFKKVVKILSKGLGDDKPKKQKSAAKPTKTAKAVKAPGAGVAKAAKTGSKTAKKAVKKASKKVPVKNPAKKVAVKKGATPAKQ